MTLLADGDSDLFIDGKLIPGGAGRFPTVNPATEEVLADRAEVPEVMPWPEEVAVDERFPDGLAMRCPWER